MRNHFVYKDKEVKRFNHVTVVEGESVIKSSTTNELDYYLTKMEDLVWELRYNEQFTGRSKCAPEDKYDEKKGLIVASRKAELKAVKHQLTKVDELKRTLEKMTDLVHDMEDQLDFKMGRLSLELVRNAREKGEE